MASQNFLLVLAAGFFGWFIVLRFVGKVAPAKAHELVAGGALLLDVRSEGEFASGHLEGAKNVPVGELARRIDELASAKDRAVVVYCASGVRSAMAKRTLVAKGFREVHDLGSMARY